MLPVGENGLLPGLKAGVPDLRNKDGNISIQLVNRQILAAKAADDTTFFISTSPELKKDDSSIKPLYLSQVSNILATLKEFQSLLDKQVKQNDAETIVDDAIKLINDLSKETNRSQDELNFRLNILKNIKSNIAVLDITIPGMHLSLIINIVQFLETVLNLYTKKPT